MANTNQWTRGAPMSDAIQTLLVEQKKMYEMYEERIRQLAAERDEARREVARSQAQYNSLMFDNSRFHDPHAIAESRGWDCFKEDSK